MRSAAKNQDQLFRLLAADRIDFAVYAQYEGLYVLRQLAMEAQLPIPEEDILNFHREVLHSIERYGRTHKLEIMLRYKIKSGHLLADLDTGVVMLAKRKLDLRPSKVHAVSEVKRLFKKAWQET